MKKKFKGSLKVLLIACFALFLGACASTVDLESNQENEVYMGSENAENEILFVFDYACSWCTKWMIDVFPEIKELTEDGSVKFKTQSVVFLNDSSLRFSKLDHLLKLEYPEKYYDVMTNIVTDSANHEDWGTESYVATILKKYDIDESLVNKEPKVDVVDVTNKLTKELELEFVPTLFVNGTKINDTFDIEEVKLNLR